MRVFRVPMNRWVILGFFLVVTVVAAATAWAFRSGLTWTAICLIAVAGPLALLYWYMLLVNPARAEIRLSEDGLHVLGPPFLDLAVPWDSLGRLEEANLGSDPVFGLQESKRGMKFGQYRCGVFTLKGGGEAFVLGNNNTALFVDAGDTRLLLAPSDLQELGSALQNQDYHEPED